MKVFNIRKILVPLDFSKTSLKALAYAAEISRASHAEIILLHVNEGLHQNLEPGYFIAPPAQQDYQAVFIEQSNNHLDAFAEKIKTKTPEKITRLTVSGKVHSTILEIAKSHKADLIVMGTHGVSGVKEFFIGSNAFKVIRSAYCPVLSVQRKSTFPSFKRILVPFRDKTHSREKVAYAIAFASLFSSDIYVLGVDSYQSKADKRKIQVEANQIKEIAEHYGIQCRVKVISGAYVADLVLNYAHSIEANCILSMADLDRVDIREYFTGPFAQQIVNHSSIPVLSIRPKINPKNIEIRFYYPASQMDFLLQK